MGAVCRRVLCRRASPLELLEHHCSEPPLHVGAPSTLEARVCFVEGRALSLNGAGSGPLEAFVDALRATRQRAFIRGARARRRCPGTGRSVRRISVTGSPTSRFGVGVHANILTAALQAACSALNRLLVGAEPALRARWLTAVGAAADGPVRAASRA